MTCKQRHLLQVISFYKVVMKKVKQAPDQNNFYLVP